jgi:hypothetical protein
MNWLKRLRNTVDCPYCGTGYCFTSETRRQTWIVNGRKDPLHPVCKQAKKEYFKGESK